MLKILHTCLLGITLLFWNQNVSAQERVTLTLPVPIASLGTELDTHIKARKRGGSCSKRLYWVGPTRIIGQTGDTLHMSTRARFELWTCGLIKTRILRDTKTLDANVRFIVTDDAISVRGELANIRNFPNWAEHILKAWFNVDFAKIQKITDRDPFDDIEVLKGIEFRIESVSPRIGPGPQDVVLDITVSFVAPDLSASAREVAKRAGAFFMQWSQ